MRQRSGRGCSNGGGGRWQMAAGAAAIAAVVATAVAAPATRARGRAAHLINAQVRVRRDDCARAKVHTLPHQVPAHAPALALQPLPQRLERPPAPLRGLLLPAQLVVREGGHVVLQQVHILLHNVARLAAAQALRHRLVGLDDVGQAVRQVILALPARPLQHDRGPHGGRRHGHHGDDHPVGARVARVEAQRLRIHVRDALQNLQRLSSVAGVSGGRRAQRRRPGARACLLR